MKEDGLKKAINRHVWSTIHQQSMTTASLSTNGTPDHYYDGAGGDLWIEYKMRDSIPHSGIVGGVDARTGFYSPLQYDWMSRRWRNGRNVLGVIGLPNGTAVIQRTPDEWLNGTHISTALSFKEIAQCINEIVGRP